MSQPASVVVFDVNETLSDLAPMAERFSDVGAPEHLAQVWFANVLRDGFALTAAGAQERFSVIAEHNLRVLLGELDVDAAVEHIMAGFMSLPVHPDVPEGVLALRASGRRLITLSNGATGVAEALLGAPGSAMSSTACSRSRPPTAGSLPAAPTNTPRRCAAPISAR